ncbi:Uncharacterised protein [Klebsiella aerogenes]|nr:Uncharacterised protein [Klebsiella aerogenes]
MCPLGKWPGKLYGPNTASTPWGTVAQRGGAVGHRRLALAGAAMVSAHRDRHLIYHGGNFRGRLPAWFTGLSGNNRRQLAFVRFQQRRKLLDDPLTRAKWQAGPGGKA